MAFYIVQYVIMAHNTVWSVGQGCQIGFFDAKFHKFGFF